MKARTRSRPAAKKLPALTLEQMIRSISRFNGTLDEGQPGVRMILTWGSADQEPAATAAKATAAPPAPAGQRFTLTEETVQDNVTGLMWSRKNVGAKRLNWEAAKKACAEAGEGGHDDWRLPTIQELLTIVDYSKSAPAIDSAFQCESSWYWTSTAAASSPSGCAWVVDFYYGTSDWSGQDDGACVRAVRAGQIIGSLV